MPRNIVAHVAYKSRRLTLNHFKYCFDNGHNTSSRIYFTLDKLKRKKKNKSTTNSKENIPIKFSCILLRFKTVVVNFVWHEGNKSALNFIFLFSSEKDKQEIYFRWVTTFFIIFFFFFPIELPDCFPFACMKPHRLLGNRSNSLSFDCRTELVCLFIVYFERKIVFFL